eukprot:1597987-Pyramimonas_sp.AAC.1
MNGRVNAAGCSPSQRVLGRGLRLPCVLADNACRPPLRGRVVSDKPFSERTAVVKAAQTPMQHRRFNQSLSRALLARSRADGARHASDVYQTGDQ